MDNENEPRQHIDLINGRINATSIYVSRSVDLGTGLGIDTSKQRSMTLF
jgi:hypothetical protein